MSMGHEFFSYLSSSLSSKHLPLQGVGFSDCAILGIITARQAVLNLESLRAYVLPIRLVIVEVRLHFAID